MEREREKKNHVSEETKEKLRNVNTALNPLMMAGTTARQSRTSAANIQPPADSTLTSQRLEQIRAERNAIKRSGVLQTSNARAKASSSANEKLKQARKRMAELDKEIFRLA